MSEASERTASIALTTTIVQIIEQCLGCQCAPEAMPFAVDDIAVGLAHEGGCSCYPAVCNSWCDSGTVSIVRLKDGRYGLFHEDSDTTGHGCQCSAGAEVHESAKHALDASGDRYREALTAQLIAAGVSL